ncbi:hypothetical protein Taro_000545 [Colocasia esculenta]|uniref:Uncharacterized protein n=1 Tax=Colocasia esculenta TaxID=4460 RepID=A0A843TDH3_COLES|nr:hypothetical protein [Colocasia esculenta]
MKEKRTSRAAEDLPQARLSLYFTSLYLVRYPSAWFTPTVFSCWEAAAASLIKKGGMSALLKGSTTLTGKSHSGMFAPFRRPTEKRRPVHPLLLDNRGEKLTRIRFVRCFTYTIPIPDCGEHARLKWLRKISAVASIFFFLHIMQKMKMVLHELGVS